VSGGQNLGPCRGIDLGVGGLPPVLGETRHHAAAQWASASREALCEACGNHHETMMEAHCTNCIFIATAASELPL
jgi:hypothetical protein